MKNYLLKCLQADQLPFFGDSNVAVSGLNEIHKVELGDVIYVDHPKYFEKALNSDASVIIINDKL